MKNSRIVLSSVGGLLGLSYAFVTKKNFLGYVGFFVLGAVAGNLISNITIKETNVSETNNETSASKPLTRPLDRA